MDKYPVEATWRVLQCLCEFVNEDGDREQLRFTAAASNGRVTLCLRLAEHDSANTLYFRENGEQLIVVSESFDKEPDWTEVPLNHALAPLSPNLRRSFLSCGPTQWKIKQEHMRLQRVIARGE
ncbi:hypothetical protein [Bradyrhizobium retamae]|uniref:hypothetical protein n=1 Tax=Bradyrhizobium retamae TaxID=1300035 RepID=UPI0007C7A9CA